MLSQVVTIFRLIVVGTIFWLGNSWAGTTPSSATKKYLAASQRSTPISQHSFSGKKKPKVKAGRVPAKQSSRPARKSKAKSTAAAVTSATTTAAPNAALESSPNLALPRASQTAEQEQGRSPRVVVPAATFVPAPPDLAVKAYILMDANSGYIIAEKNSTQHLAPASLTKLMTLYLIADSLRSGRINFTDQVTISEKAWRVGGSRMFVKVGTNVAVEDLIKGIVVVSGNDATIAMAEYIAGSEEGFVKLMNHTARSLGMHDSNFTDSNGLLNGSHYSSALDLAVLARNWLENFPEYYGWFKEKWFTHNGIRQPNRNRLLWRNPWVDGIKTGHTDEAGYCLIVSALRNNMRLISVILGAQSDELRAKYSEALLNYGFRFFTTRQLFAANTPIVTPRVWLGKDKATPLGLKEPFYITVPVEQHANLKAKVEVGKKLQAPLVKGESYGKLLITLAGDTIATQPLVALQDNKRANFLGMLFDYFLMLFHH